MKVIIRLRPPRKRSVVRTTIAAAALLLAGGGAYYFIASASASSAPQRAEKQYQLGMELIKPGTYPQAIAHFGNAIAVQPEYAEAYLQRGIVHQIVGESEAALADLDHALALDPALAQAQSARGKILRDQGNIQGAIEAMTASIKIKPTMDAYYQRGLTYEALGQHQKAIDDYDQAIDLMSNAPYVYRSRALAKHNLGDLKGEEADRALANERDHDPIH